MNAVQPYRALIISGDPSTHELFKSLLGQACTAGMAEKAGPGSDLQTEFPVFEIHSVALGEKGLELAEKASEEERPYTMAFVDMQMPTGWGGIETVSRLWKQCFELQMVICTSHQDESWHEIIRRFGHSGRLLILTKPYDETEVRQVAFSLAEKWDLARQARSHLERLQGLVGERTAKLESANQSLQKKVFQNQQAERRLVTQYAVGKIVSEALPPAEMFARVFQTIGENLDWDWAAMWEWAAETDTLRPGRCWRRQDPALEAFEAASRAATFTPRSGLPGRAWSDGQAVWMEDVAQESGSERAGAAAQANLHCAVALPVWAGSRQFGVMEFMSHEIRERDTELMQMLSVAGGALAQYLERKRAEDERKVMEVQLRGAQKLEAIGLMAAGVAHEINTPTQYIGDNVRFLETSFRELKQTHDIYERLLLAVKCNAATPGLIAEADERVHRTDLGFLVTEIPRAIQQTLEGVERVSMIVRAMKDFSHPGTEEKTPVDLNRAIDTTLTVARNEWKYVARMETEFDPNLPMVPCLPGEFNQVILNLVVNAAHAVTEANGEDGKRKGVITVSTRRQGEWAEVSIRDTGCGIPENIRPKIFVPFFTTKPVGKGTGQGLAMARTAIVERHQGTLTFESQTGVGTVFTIRLPLNPPPAPKREAPVKKPENHETSFVRR